MEDRNDSSRQRKRGAEKKRPGCMTKDEILGRLQYTPIPLAIPRSNKLSMGAKMLYGEFLSWAYNNGGICRPPQVVVAWHLNVTVRQMQRLQDELETSNAIIVVRRKTAKNASKPNKILFVRRLRHLCAVDRLSNKACHWRPAIRREQELRKKNAREAS